MLTKLLIGAAGVAAGYFGAMYLVSYAMLKDPKRMHGLVDKAQERVKARRRRRAEDLYGAGQGIGAQHQPFEAVQRYSDAWNPTHPTDPASR